MSVLAVPRSTDTSLDRKGPAFDLRKLSMARSPTGRPETADPASRLRECLDLDEIEARDGPDNELRDTVTAIDLDDFLTQVYQEDLYLTSIIGINSSRSV
jgi:hypothetical protein